MSFCRAPSPGSRADRDPARGRRRTAVAELENFRGERAALLTTASAVRIVLEIDSVNSPFAARCQLIRKDGPFLDTNRICYRLRCAAAIRVIRASDVEIGKHFANGVFDVAAVGTQS